MGQHNRPEKAGEPQKVDTDTESCPNCGVVQEFDVYLQRYENSPDYHYPKHTCPVCEHEFEDPW